MNRPHKCLACFKTFTSKELLDHHIARVHELRNCETCPYCNKQYSRLKAHLGICPASVFKSEKQKFKCLNENCDKAYEHKHSLNKHAKECPKKL